MDNTMDKSNAETIQLNKKAGRDISLDAVKGFAILLVMLGHCIVLNGLADPYLYDAIAAVQMPLFMAVSGYIAGLKKPEAVERPDLAKCSGFRETKHQLPGPLFFMDGYCLFPTLPERA